MAEMPAEDVSIRLLQAAYKYLQIMGNFWSQRTQAQELCDRCTYSPVVIDYHLRNWEELVAAAYGVSASGASLLGGGGESGRGKWVSVKADIESATDKALVNGTYLKWHAVRRIYVKQDRLSFYEARLRELHRWHTFKPDHTAPEPRRAGADAICRELIALRLGWSPHECEDIA